MTRDSKGASELQTNEHQLVNHERLLNSIGVFEKQDANVAQKENAIVFVGSSSFTRWNSTVRKDMHPLTVIPRGFGGSTMEDVLHYVDQLVLKYNPRAIVLYEGDNDIAVYGMSAEEVRDDVLKFLKIVRSKNPTIRTYIVSIKPSPARLASWPEQEKANGLLKEISENDDQLFFLDVASHMFLNNGEINRAIFVNDNIHMNGDGYAIWKKIIRSELMRHETKHEGETLSSMVR